MAKNVEFLMKQDDERKDRARRAQVEKERLELKEMLRKEKEERERLDLLAAKVPLPTPSIRPTRNRFTLMNDVAPQQLCRNDCRFWASVWTEKKQNSVASPSSGSSSSSRRWLRQLQRRRLLE